MSKELTWEQILSPDFNNAINKLMRQNLEYKSALKVLSISKELKVEQQKAEDMRKILQDRFYDKSAGENGMIKFAEKPGVEADVKAANKDFIGTKFKMKSAMIMPDDLSKVALTPLELMALEPIIQA